MKKSLFVVSSVALVATLAACQKKAEAPAPTPSASAMSGIMAEMPMAGAMKHGMAAGKVVSVNAETGAISIEHGPMTGLNWPAMTMGFTAKPEQLAGIKVGDRVDFEIDWDGKTGTITKIKII